MIKQTVDYYNTNADKFYTSTVSADMSSIYTNFQKYLPKDATVLDCGCGSGRDSKYFLDNGYKVVAIDASEEMCKKAIAYIGQEVRCIEFADITSRQYFDGIWACASLLHVKKDELPSIMNKLHTALKDGGILYSSFKYGDFEGIKNGRYFTNFTEESFKTLLENTKGFEILDMWVTGDVREGRNDERWLNVFMRKN